VLRVDGLLIDKRDCLLDLCLLLAVARPNIKYRKKHGDERWTERPARV
jgi:hypothetical protein